MRAIRLPGKAKLDIGTMVIDCDHPCPFEAENDFEEALLFFLHKIGNAVEDQLASAQGEINNAVEGRLIGLEETLSVKLDAVIEELRLMRQGMVI